MSLSEYREDGEKQRSGSPIYLSDMTFFVKRFGTPESQEQIKNIRREMFGPFHKSQEGDENLVLAEWLVWAVTGWENVVEDTGDEVKELKYSKKVARKLFTDPEYFLSLNAELVASAMRFEHYLYDESREDEQALKKP